MGVTRRTWGEGSLYQRGSDGRWIGAFHRGSKTTYVTSVRREDVEARLAGLAEEWPRAAREDEAFWAKVDTSGDCWEWQGAITTAGYGQMRFDGRLSHAHQVAFQIHGGVVPEGMELDHLCANRRCVNPAHLEPVTHGENIRRAVRRRRAIA
jgi:hypothetical protein